MNEEKSQTIDSASEGLTGSGEPIKWTPEDELQADMEKLARIDRAESVVEAQIKHIHNRVDEFLIENGLKGDLERLEEELKEHMKEFRLLKEDIGERALKIFKKSANTDPAPGVKIKQFSRKELVLSRDKKGWPEEAVAWAVEKELLTLLTIVDETYMNVLESGVFPDMPGEIDEDPEYKAYISLKPYLEEE